MSLMNKIGPEFIPIAFATAALYDSTTKLYINDYNLEYNGAKAVATRQVVASLIARGIKIDGVGLQGHLIVAKTPGLSSLTAMVQSFASLGVEVAYTELDVRHEVLPPTAAGLTQQDVDFGNAVLSCVNVVGCVGVTIWDYTDKYSWIPSVFSGQGDALLWDKDLVKKQVYSAVQKVLGGGVSSTSSTAVATTSSKASSTVVITTSSIASSTAVITTSSIKTTIPVTSSTTMITSTRTTTVVTSSKTSSVLPTTSGGSLSNRWEQCGGSNWKGPTACVSPWVCTFGNPWYSQCL